MAVRDDILECYAVLTEPWDCIEPFEGTVQAGYLADVDRERLQVQGWTLSDEEEQALVDLCCHHLVQARMRRHQGT